MSRESRNDDGLVEIDDDAVAACVADLADPVCLNGVPAELSVDTCAFLVRGVVEEGDACDDSAQCASRFCDFDCRCGAEEPGRALVDVDALPCVQEFDCPLGDTCFFDPDSPFVNTECIAACGSNLDCEAGQAYRGSVCQDLGGIGGECFEGAECATNLACIENLCGAPRIEGSPCDFDCGSEQLFCDGLQCQQRTGSGQPCSDFEECIDGFNCDQGGTNTCIPGPGIGQPCDFSGSFECGPNLECAFEETEVCRPLPGLGEQCFFDDGCASRACDESRSICVNNVLVGDGEDCTTSLCADGQVCAANICADRVSGHALGDTCSAGVRGTCPLGLSCDGAGTCQVVEVVVDGACNANFETGPLCAGLFSGRFCDIPAGDDVGVCADSPAAGDPCPDFVCSFDSSCRVNDVGDAQVCIARSPEGGPCNAAEGNTCDFDLFCDIDTCVQVQDIESGLQFSCEEGQ